MIWTPNAGPQTAFLASVAREVLYGGAAGGGKSDALLALALRHADHPKHRAIILRRTRPQLQELIDRSQMLYPDIVPGAAWIERESRWRLPMGGYIRMGHAEHEDDIMQYKSDEYNLVAFDEGTSFTPKQYKFMFSRNRSKSPDLPPLMRVASNPGDVSHEFFFERFIRNKEPFKVYESKELVEVGGRSIETSITRQFIPAKVVDNPKLANAEAYIAGLLEMGDEGLMYLHGVWTHTGGTMFKKLPLEVAPSLLRTNYYVVNSMDYGLNDATSIHWFVVYDDDTVDIAGEVYINEVDLDEIARQVFAYEKNVLKVRTPVIRVGDPKMFAREGTSMQSIASILASKGLMYEKANNDRVAGWAQVQRYIYRGQLRVWMSRAPNLMRTMPNMLRDPNKPNDLKNRQEDHAVDSLRYGLMAIFEKGAAAAKRPSDDGDERYRDKDFDKYAADAAAARESGTFEQLGDWQ